MALRLNFPIPKATTRVVVDPTPQCCLGWPNGCHYKSGHYCILPAGHKGPHRCVHQSTYKAKANG